MIAHHDIPFRLIIAAQMMAMGIVRAYFGAPRGEDCGEASAAPRTEPAWLTATLGVLALLHFGAIFAFLVDPPLLRWSVFKVAVDSNPDKLSRRCR
jgi:hypothetical protein